jgi:hypothetical protein
MHHKFYRLTAQNVGHRSLLCNSEHHHNMQEGSPVDQNNRLIIIINGVTIHKYRKYACNCAVLTTEK